MHVYPDDLAIAHVAVRDRFLWADWQRATYKTHVSPRLMDAEGNQHEINVDEGLCMGVIPFHEHMSSVTRYELFLVLYRRVFVIVFVNS